MVKSTDSELTNYIAKVRTLFEDNLSRLVNIPTVSADPAHRSDINRGAKLAADFLKEAGLEANVVTTAGNPVVMGRYISGPTHPTVALYNHLDVQPADNTEWQTDPFSMQTAGQRYIGRGATDDKGPALTALMAIRYAIAHKLPLNINVIWEFEEEIGSTHFKDFMESQQELLKNTNSVVISDTIWISADRPAVPYGLRGMLGFELRLRTAKQDVHSGLAGGVARNPIAELSQVISECFEATSGKVKIPGFYDDVQAASAVELQSFIDSGFDVKQFMKSHGLKSLRTYDVKQVLSRIMAEPTFEVHGIVGGYSGEGIKTIVPPAATAKLSVRLVPTQDPYKIFELIKKFVQKDHPDVEVVKEGVLEPYLGEFTGPYADAARSAVEYAFGVTPAFVREGGSIGAVLTMRQQLNVPIILLGLSLPEHGYHAPNEYFDWHQASGGIKMFVHYFEELATKRLGRA